MHRCRVTKSVRRNSLFDKCWQFLSCSTQILAEFEANPSGPQRLASISSSMAFSRSSTFTPGRKSPSTLNKLGPRRDWKNAPALSASWLSATRC